MYGVIFKMFSSDSGIVLLAAGSGLRFGANKLLADFNGKPLCHYSMNAVKESGLPAVVVYEDEDVAEIARNHGLKVIKSPVGLKGQGVSIGCGTKHFKFKRSVMIAVADMPFIKVKTITELNERYKKLSTSKILTCHISGRRCPPIVFGRKYIKDLLSVSGDIGARDVLFRHPDSIELFELSSDEEAIDVDTYDQLKDLVDQRVFPDIHNS